MGFSIFALELELRGEASQLVPVKFGVVLSSGVWTGEGAMENSSALTSLAFESYFGEFGTKASYGMQVVYIFAIIFGAVGAAEVIWGFLDIMLRSYSFRTYLPSYC
ncbi:hypothetical protein QMA09_07670 [Planococcus sp. APC 3906]|uniref:hypothetical protein n=1 Tax=Planococcus sp. APC 3906 TaxID=3035194 RepID=UPI0025B5A7D9|nr:hypothetical protein [Planococcus sp. APC 3906]MDN3450065.1 hypothetical protein [Planococcus sp. APC 3906]